jgi:manganese-dependent inorganic pyrophosphatase
VGFKKFYEVKDALAKKLDGFLAQEGCNFGCLMATDITKETTLLLCSGSKKIIDSITYPKMEENIFEMKGVLSRKKQVLPYLIDLMRGL